MSRTRIVIFAKAPMAGKVKTRLIPALGEQGAARLAEDMLRETCAQALAADLGPVELCFSADPEWAGPLPARVELSEQGDGDLGERLWRAASRAGPPLLLIGTDCPELDSGRLAEAARRLAASDAVLHPAEDGGYVLLGLNRLDPSLFEGIAWSTPAVAAQTIARIEALGWSLHVGETLRDIDEPQDLLRHSRFRRNGEEDRDKA